MQFFDQLGALVEQRWKERNFDDAAFADVAQAAFERMRPSEHTDYREILQWVLEAHKLPPQDLKSGFGEPPLTLYKADLFYIEALFWLTGQTEIHEHSFAGAFHVLEGSSLHCRYAFDLEQRINSRLLLGNVRMRSAECLMKGDSRPIHPGDQSSHFTFHLEKPTVTIVIRTPVNEEARPQRAYLKPSLAVDGFSRREVSTRQLQLLNFLHEARDPDYAARAAQLISRTDLEAAFWILDHAHRTLDAEQFGQVFAASRREHGEVVERFTPVLCAMRRAEKINSRCRYLEKPEHRFLLGLLHAFRDRAAIFKFLRSQFDDDPIDLISKWVEEMTSLARNGDSSTNALGIRFDESSLLLFRYLLEGLSFAEVKKRLKEEYDPEDVDAQEEELRLFFSTLRDSILFEPLFAAGDSAAFEITGRRWQLRTRPQQLLDRAESATRGLLFVCSLDSPPTDLLPAKAQRFATGNDDVVVNPTFRFEPASATRTSNDGTRSFLPAAPRIWITNPGTQIETAFSVDAGDAQLFSKLEGGEAKPIGFDGLHETLRAAHILVAPDYTEGTRREWERLSATARGEFESQGFTTVPSLIDPLPLAAMRRYYRQLVASGRLALGDGQVDGRYALYNEPLARFFHKQLTDLMSRVAGEAVKPSYVYFASYQPGAVLIPHLDRPQCQFSISFLVDYVPEPEDASPWPLLMQRKGAAKPTTVHQKIGDAVFYKGCEVVHSREALPENHFSTSLFFHFVPATFEGELA